MNLRDLLTSPISDLPRKRDPKLSLSDQLAGMYADFVGALETLDSADPICKPVQQELKLIKKASRYIRSAVDAYLNGFPYKAYEHLLKALKLLEPFLDKLKVPRNKLDNLYRVREVDTLADRERKDLFHVPFELRHRVRTQRYSISGWPSLYLGASLLVCWEEVGRPAFHTLSVAAFSAKGNVSVLDFGYRPAVAVDLHERDGFFTKQQMTSYVVCWPLLAACAFRVQHRGESFIEEYIIPQLLLQWLRNKAKGIDGLRYFSTHVEQSSFAPWLAINYVFPVKTQAHDGYCAELTKKFELTLPVPWILLDGIELKTMGTQRTDTPYVLNPELLLNYDDTVFKKLEDRINSNQMLKATLKVAPGAK